MTYADAINYNLKDGYAAKRPNWAGYIKRVDSTTTDGAYTLTYVNRAGQTKGVYEVSAAGVITATTALSMDADFQTSILMDDWTVAKTTDCEESRSGVGKEW